jgi:excisionase family DNA binding protein
MESERFLPNWTATPQRREALMSGEAPETLTVVEVATMLRVSRPTILALAASGQIPARRVGKQWRFSRASLLKWLQGERRVSH